MCSSALALHSRTGDGGGCEAEEHTPHDPAALSYWPRVVLRKIGQPTTCFDHVLADLEDEEEPLTLAVVRPRDTRGQTGPHCAAVMPGTVAVPVDLLDKDTAASLDCPATGQTPCVGGERRRILRAERRRLGGFICWDVVGGGAMQGVGPMQCGCACSAPGAGLAAVSLSIVGEICIA